MRHRNATITRLATIVVASLTGLVLVPAAPAGAAPVLSVAESRADELVSTINADPATYAGVSIDESSDTLTVRYARNAGQTAALARVSNLTTRSVQPGAQSLRVQLVPADHSVQELQAVREKVVTDPDWRKAAGDTVSEWYVDIRTNRVAVGLTRLTPAIEALTSKLSDGLASLHVAARPQEQATRLDDFEPWAAGSRINIQGGCTGGFIIRNNNNPTERRLVTAGHCGVDGTTVTNNGDTVGTVVGRNYVQNGLDVEYVAGSTYAPWTYKGPANSDFGDDIRSTSLPLVGRTYCTNGATSGETCTGTIRATDLCVTFTSGKTTCFLDRMTSTVVLSRPGDSGGNFFAYNNVGLQIGGIIIGGTGTTTYVHAYSRVIPQGWRFHGLTV